MPVLPSYRNQSIDFLRKSTDWFLYEGNTGISCVEMKSKARIYFIYLCLLLKTTLSCSAMHSVWFPVTISLLLKILKNFADICGLSLRKINFFIKGTFSGLKQLLATESPLTMIKTAFYFTLKALFVFKIFKFLSWLFSNVEIRFD